MYKKGNKVKVIKKCGEGCQNHPCFIGKIGIIIEVYPDGRFLVDNFPLVNGFHLCSGFYEDCLELVESIIKPFGIVNFCKA